VNGNIYCWYSQKYFLFLWAFVPVIMQVNIKLSNVYSLIFCLYINKFFKHDIYHHCAGLVTIAMNCRVTSKQSFVSVYHVYSVSIGNILIWLWEV
jgi:hypothetical protein